MLAAYPRSSAPARCRAAFEASPNCPSFRFFHDPLRQGVECQLIKLTRIEAEIEWFTYRRRHLHTLGRLHQIGNLGEEIAFAACAVLDLKQANGAKQLLHVEAIAPSKIRRQPSFRRDGEPLVPSILRSCISVAQRRAIPLTRRCCGAGRPRAVRV